MTFNEQKQRILDLEAMIGVAVGYIESGTPELAAIVLIGSRADGFQALQDAERKLLQSATVDGPTAAEADDILGRRHYEH